MTLDSKLPGLPESRAIDAQASLLMKQGIRLLGDARPEAVTEALACFDRALELRRSLPIDLVPAFRYGLAACWMNRADALMRLRDAAQTSVALRAYDEAIVLLCGLPLHEEARFLRRLAIAHQNRGLALLALGRSSLADAVAAFSEAIAILDRDRAALISDRPYLRAAVWMNLANAWASETNAESMPRARDAARRAMALVEDLEANDADAAEVGLKARHVLCQTIARYLPPAAASGQTIPQDVHEATDVADDGLGLARRWEQKGISRFRAIAYDLFRFGARVYARFQPQFLNEFVLDNIDPGRSSPEYVESPEIRWAVREALGLSTGAGS